MLKLGVFLVVTLLAVTGCDLVKRESSAWRDQVDTSIKALNASIDKAALAIPGERYSRLVDAAIGDDKNARDKAIAQVKKLFDIDLEAKYEVELKFGHDDSKPLRVDFFFGAAPSPATVVQYCIDKDTFAPTGVKNQILPPPTSQEIDARITAELESAIDVLGAKAQVVGTIDLGSGILAPGVVTQFVRTRESGLNTAAAHGVSPPQYKAHPYVVGKVPIEVIEQHDRRKQAAKHLRNALEAMYGDLKRQPVSGVLRRDFSPVAGRPYVVVLIQDSDLIQQKNVVVEITAYRKRTPEEAKANVPIETLGQRWAVKLEKHHFDANRRLPCGNPEVKVAYALHNITEVQGVTPEVLEAVMRSKDLVTKWSKSK